MKFLSELKRMPMAKATTGAAPAQLWYQAVLWLMLFLLFPQASEASVGQKPYISNQKVTGSFTLATNGKPAPLYVSHQDFPGVQRVAKHLQADLQRVTQTEPSLRVSNSLTSKEKEVVLIGTLGKSPLIDKLVKQKKLNVDGVAGKRETFLIQTVEKPMKGVDRALVIIGSDKRGTIYGMYDLSTQIGVSPWYYWADVPVRQQQNLFVLPGRHTEGEPVVEYRGIFINDEAPALSGWSKEQFGGFNHKFYDKVFELLLRMKGNYLWPAMWGSAFSDDDPLNAPLADEYGVVIGTSHHEPLMRAHDEWRRYGSGPWNYDTNKAELQEFWRKGIERMGTKESIISVGMRGDGDEPMSEESNIALLEKIVEDQRKIIADVTGKPASETPQLWALYKEVQEYYDKGMRVPDDVTLLLCDDNWGNIRKLPKPNEKPHPGGYGIYYHYDYVGGPRNYKWLNTNPIPRVWEQMHLAYRHGATKIWIVNVGDIKPMEFPTEFFLDYAWNPEKWPVERLQEYTQLWAAREFGTEHAAAIAGFVSRYTKYNSRRKPELLAPDTYSLVNYREAARVVGEYNQLAEEAEKLYNVLPAAVKDAYYQLVLHPIKACANLNELHVTTGLNRLYAKQGRATANTMAAKVKALFEKDQELSRYYNKTMAGGKWNHMMDQTHISYTYWQQPEKDVLPELKEVKLPAAAAMGVAVEGSEAWWPEAKQEAVLPTIVPFQQKSYYIDVFNRGTTPFDFTVQTGAPWLTVSATKGKVEQEQRLLLHVNWQQAPKGQHRVPITISGPKESKVVVQAEVNNSMDKPLQENTFVEENGFIAIEAEHYTRAQETEKVKWQLLPDLGRTGSAMTAFPVTAPAQKPADNSPCLEYRIHLQQPAEVVVHAYLSPTLNFNDTQGLRYAVSIDDETPQIVNIHQGENEKLWEQWVANNINIKTTKHHVKTPGEHVLKFWMVDPAVVLQRLVIDTGGLKPSYLGPPESYRQANEVAN
ncbi:glycosyl hydrolase 115 family protein [Pontibacter sp. 13R65]|uniref:glycosyl hydrolase 115 family protein n=1 Tax=Pontibacter sp. 13R65 TaxID=3127458 RepID=UPI00301C2571